MPCERCGGRGWIVVADGRAGSARPCPCRTENVVPRLVTDAGIPARYRHCRLGNFHVSSSKARQDGQLLQARRIAQQYVDDFLQVSDTGVPQASGMASMAGIGGMAGLAGLAGPGGGGVGGSSFRNSGLLFSGPPGVGKTHLAAGVLVELIERYRIHGLFVEFTSLIHQIQATFDPGSAESKRQVLDPLMDAELLVLDELGSQQPTPWVRDILYLIINGRYTRRLPTLFTTNYRLEGLGVSAGTTSIAVPPRSTTLDRGRDAEPVREEPALLSSRLPPMLVSRLYEMAQPVVLDGVEDFRREHAVHGAHLR